MVKKIIGIIFFITLIILIYSISKHYKSNKIITKNYQNYETIYNNNIYIIKSKGHSLWDMNFLQSGSTTYDINKFYNTSTGGKYIHPIGKNCSAINGGYFGYDNSGGFIPAGNIYNKNSSDIISTIETGKDINLQNLININNGEFKFYSGPVIISGGIINAGLSQNISHRQWEAPRTFLIKRSDELIDIGIYNSGISLQNLSEYIYNLNIYTGNYDVINLDGGPSTSIVTPDYKFNENQKLPRFFNICD